MSMGKADYELDYVYMKNEEIMFDSVHVILNIGEERMTMTLQSEVDVAPEDVAEILDGLETGTLKKMHIAYGVNCDVFLMVGDKAFKVDAVKEDTTIVTLSPAE